MSLALALHELATNAAKYGALANDTGQVRISWEIETAGRDEPMLRFNWRETGGPPVVTPQSTGFGSRLINQMLAADLRSAVEIEYHPEGLRCTVAAPLSVLAGSA